MKTSVIDFCTRIGRTPLLVQGAGGNVSWKDGDTLWIKASGTWLADAAEKDIFLPVDLPHLQHAVANGDFAAPPKTKVESALRPSIETLLHALMPHRIVIHIHAIEALALLVRTDFKQCIRSLLGNRATWTSVNYFKPGAALAQAVAKALSHTPSADLVFMQNHGIVIGGETLADVEHILTTVNSALAAPQRPLAARDANDGQPLAIGKISYRPIADTAIHQLALDPALFCRLRSDWALYPDHVVFLGKHPALYDGTDHLAVDPFGTGLAPKLVFIKGHGVFVTPDFTPSQQAQLRCYYDVLSRIPDDAALSPLNEMQVAELTNWDAERYRQALNNTNRK